MAEIHSGTFRKPKPILFSEYAAQWLKTYAPTAQLKPSTFETYQSIIDKRFNPVFGKLLLTHLSTRKIKEFLSACLKDGLAPKTVNNTLILLKTMLMSAVDDGYLLTAPTRKVRRMKLEPKEMGFLTPQEIQLLLKHADEPYRTLFLAAVLTGMREGELFALQWGDIDWHQDRIGVQRSLYWRSRKNIGPEEPCWMFVTPKSRCSRRTVVMSPKLKEALGLYRLSCPVSPYDLVFCTSKGNPLDPNTMLSREFHPALTRAGLRKVRFHDLRHTYTSLLIAQGEDIKFIQNQLGHASARTTLDHYGHLMPGVHQRASRRLDRQVFGRSASASTPQAERPATGQNSSKPEQDRSALTPTHSKG